MALTMTPAAVKRVNVIRQKRQTPEAVLRVGVRGGGCSGLSYFMDFVDTPEEKDKVFEFNDGVILAVDRILDMVRTTVNVSGDATGAVVVNRWFSEEA